MDHAIASRLAGVRTHNLLGPGRSDGSQPVQARLSAADLQIGAHPEQPRQMCAHPGGRCVFGRPPPNRCATHGC